MANKNQEFKQKHKDAWWYMKTKMDVDCKEPCVFMDYPEEFYKEINKTKIYKPSLLFGWSDKILGLAQRLNKDVDSDPDKVLKDLVIGFFVVAGIILGLGIILI